MTVVLDRLDALEAAVPGLADRVDHHRIALAGHSWGAQTVSTLAGARVIGADGAPGPSTADPRVEAAVLLALTGTGGPDLRTRKEISNGFYDRTDILVGWRSRRVSSRQ